MKKYQYQVVRYRHDLVTGEFVNVGIVLYSPEERILDSKFITRYSRITHFYDDVNGNYLVKVLKHFKNQIDLLKNNFNSLFSPEYKSITEITEPILLKDDLSIFCSDIYNVIDLSFESALNDLYERFVDKYVNESDKDVRDDKFVWKNIYKKYFDEYNITDKLTSHTVLTKNDKIEFDKTWKNGIWNCFESVSFDLKKPESIKNKIYRWNGILNELETAQEKINLYFLTALPNEKEKTLTDFIKDTFSREKYQSINVSLITESEAKELASTFKEKIENHHS
ncbi:DUF3037 domain-containing protein [Chryseobacterium sp. JK1]|uniref:DUF3037 domain-containing protein n=1 Tax=Chryseobacterium sp. JK1 TaxID=874294 RepID=UPI003D69D420